MSGLRKTTGFFTSVSAFNLSQSCTHHAASGKFHSLHMKNESDKANNNTLLSIIMVLIRVLGTPGVPGTRIENHYFSSTWFHQWAASFGCKWPVIITPMSTGLESHSQDALLRFTSHPLHTPFIRPPETLPEEASSPFLVSPSGLHQTSVEEDVETEAQTNRVMSKI